MKKTKYFDKYNDVYINLMDTYVLKSIFGL
jgi:hypothetical protein